MSQLNCMLDLETMGLNPRAAIIAIGAVMFKNGKVFEEAAFYQVVSLQDSVDSGLVMDPSTVLWWLGQSQEAREEFTRRSAASLIETLYSFTDWLGDDVLIWGNGASFDNVILGNAYDACKIRRPWSYRNDRCFRTLKALHPEVPDEANPSAHNALADAVHQARHAVRCLIGASE